MDPPPTGLVLDSDAKAAALTGFTGPPDLFVGYLVSRSALARLLGRQPVAGLTLWSFSGGADAEFLRGHTSLRRLRIHAWTDLSDLGALHGLPLEEVSLSLDNSTPLGPALASWPRLRRFSLTGRNGPWSFGDFSEECRPESLDLTGTAPDLAGLGRLRSLRHLGLGYDWRPAGEAAWAELSALRDLRGIEVHPDVLEGLAEFADLPSLRKVWCYDDDKESDPDAEERMLRRFPHARIRRLPQTYDV